MNSITEIINLLKELIKIPSFSREECKTADLLENFINNKGYKVNRKINNLWVFGNNNKPKKPYVLLCSHHDTVKPVNTWTKNPFEPLEENGKIYGLGSNDAGASLVSLLAAFLQLDQQENPFNLIYAASAEEEVSGLNGMTSLISELGHIDLAIIGEPTQMQMAVAEKGLMVIDCESHGKAGHAARNEGINAIYIAHKDIEWIKNYCFPKKSDLLGEVKMTVTMINAGQQHNVVPDKCSFVIDVRANELYSNEEIFSIIQSNLKSIAKARSFRLNSSSINTNHPIVKKGIEMGLTYFGSPTTSDQSVIPFTSIKIGPGDSSRSHSADEFIYIDEINKGVETYINLLSNLLLC
ncbi:MAG: M20 family metallo-hydrolase [Bacteroidales bacterium]|nr:M20 family metallo-hydrolase [Bacteroidales bacterium]